MIFLCILRVFIQRKFPAKNIFQILVFDFLLYKQLITEERMWGPILSKVYIFKDFDHQNQIYNFRTVLSQRFGQSFDDIKIHKSLSNQNKNCTSLSKIHLIRPRWVSDSTLLRFFLNRSFDENHMPLRLSKNRDLFLLQILLKFETYTLFRGDVTAILS